MSPIRTARVIILGQCILCYSSLAPQLRVHGNSQQTLVPKSIATGRGHACLLTYRGDVGCWGGGEYGVLGDGSTDSSATIVGVPLGSPALQVSAGLDNICALLSIGWVKCWGVFDSVPGSRALYPTEFRASLQISSNWSLDFVTIVH